MQGSSVAILVDYEQSLFFSLSVEQTPEDLESVFCLIRDVISYNVKLAGSSSFSLQLFFYYLERGFHLGQKRTGGGVNSNRPLPRHKNSHSVHEAKCKTFPVKKSFICMKIKNHFHINNFALSLALKKNLGATRKWP